MMQKLYCVGNAERNRQDVETDVLDSATGSGYVERYTARFKLQRGTLKNPYGCTVLLEYMRITGDFSSN